MSLENGISFTLGQPPNITQEEDLGSQELPHFRLNLDTQEQKLLESPCMTPQDYEDEDEEKQVSLSFHLMKAQYSTDQEIDVDSQPSNELEEGDILKEQEDGELSQEHDRELSKEQDKGELSKQQEEGELQKEARPEIKVNALPEIQKEAQPETQIVAQPETQIVAQPETQIVAQPETQIVVIPATQIVVIPATQIKTQQLEVQPELQIIPLSENKPILQVPKDVYQVILSQEDQPQNQMIVEKSDVMENEVQIERKVSMRSKVITNVETVVEVTDEVTRVVKQRKEKLIKQESIIQIDEDDDEVMILSQRRMVLKNGWDECTIGDTKGVSPRFLGSRRVNLRKANPGETFRYFFFERLQRGILAQVAEQHIVIEDVLQFIATKILMGYMKYPELKDYYRQDKILGTQIPTLMESKMFTYLESKLEINAKIYQNNLVNVKLEEENKEGQDEFLRQASRKFNKKLSQSLNPGQWLVLIKNQSLQAVTQNLELFQLIDRDSNYILKQFFWTVKQDRKSLQNRIMDLLLPYAGLNHVVFVEQRILDGQTIFVLYQRKILVCSWTFNSNVLPESVDRRIFKNQSMFSLAQKDEVLIFPGFEYLQQIQPVLSSVSRHFLISEKISIVPTDGSHNMLAFYFTLETIINNCYCLYPLGNYKEYRIQLAQSLLKEPLQVSTKETVVVDRPQTSTVGMQTLESSFGLPLEKALHCPIFDGNARCVVCLHEGTLTKTQASCLGCSDTLRQKQYLCLLPCFRKFHMDPAKYLERPRDAKLVEGYYDDYPVDEGPDSETKPDTSDLQAIYAIQHKNLDESDYYAQQFGVPINYEDDFRCKTKWVKKQTKRPPAQPRQPSAPRKKVPAEKRVSFDLPGQGNQGNSYDQSEGKKKRGRKPQQQQQQTSLAQNPTHQPAEQNAVVDFFSMVRKKVMSNQNGH